VIRCALQRLVSSDLHSTARPESPKIAQPVMTNCSTPSLWDTSHFQFTAQGNTETVMKEAAVSPMGQGAKQKR
jgi:hypothetical protein